MGLLEAVKFHQHVERRGVYGTNMFSLGSMLNANSMDTSGYFVTHKEMEIDGISVVAFGQLAVSRQAFIVTVF